MREIKFRAWDEINNKLVMAQCIDFINNNIHFLDNTFKGNPVYINQFRLMQYTGLKDKNGEEIYESDLCLLYDPYNGLPAIGYAQVVFSYAYVGGWVLISNKGGLLNIGTRTKDVEVIGNIYENPELLK